MAASLPILAATGARFPPSPFFTDRKDQGIRREKALPQGCVRRKALT
jgi:hypothetical protein